MDGPKPGEQGSWRLMNIAVPMADDPGLTDTSVHDALYKAVCMALDTQRELDSEGIRIVRKSFDGRRNQEKRFVYVVDVDADAADAAESDRLTVMPSKLEWVPNHEELRERAEEPPKRHTAPGDNHTGVTSGCDSQTPVVIVGSGPAGLFAALTAAEAGLPVVIVERGQTVEKRGSDIGALFVRRKLNPDSNLCYGEGGAGTWSDGKLTTRIGRNSDPVTRVLDALVQFGAPEYIRVVGKPHLGTDRLVRLLKNCRSHLQALGTKFRFGCTVEELLVEDGRAVGVRLNSGEELQASSVILAVGHSARGMYRHLAQLGVSMRSKPFSMGFRIEHPQDLINRAQYGDDDAEVLKTRIPADYRLAMHRKLPRQPHPADAAAATPAAVREQERHMYSFCMCPGGQIVPTSTSEDELCINGMSFSRRNSRWANSALVVGVLPEDWQHYEEFGPLAGMHLQVEIERKAARMGGGSCVVPVQRATDFVAGVVSEGELPPSSYRLGVKSAPLHELYSAEMTQALRLALAEFNDTIPGFLSADALLHAAETRTSAPLQIQRGDDFQSLSMPGLYPCGEGAGYAGGIVSSAVDGIFVGEALVQQQLGLAPRTPAKTKRVAMHY